MKRLLLTLAAMMVALAATPAFGITATGTLRFTATLPQTLSIQIHPAFPAGDPAVTNPSPYSTPSIALGSISKEAALPSHLYRSVGSTNWTLGFWVSINIVSSRGGQNPCSLTAELIDSTEAGIEWTIGGNYLFVGSPVNWEATTNQATSYVVEVTIPNTYSGPIDNTIAFTAVEN